MALVLDGFTNISDALRCGIYALCYRGQVIYVGQSKCMLVRVYSHRHARNKKAAQLPSWFPIRGIVYDEVHVLPVHPDRLDEVEREMINRFKPKLNTQLKNKLPVNVPVSLEVGGVSLVLNSGAHPRAPQIERRI
jgi:hypothetical protein